MTSLAQTDGYLSLEQLASLSLVASGRRVSPGPAALDLAHRRVCTASGHLTPPPTGPMRTWTCGFLWYVPLLYTFQLSLFPDLPGEAGERGTDWPLCKPRPPSHLLRILASPDQIFRETPLIYRSGTFSQSNSSTCGSRALVRGDLPAPFLPSSVTLSLRSRKRFLPLTPGPTRGPLLNLGRCPLPLTGAVTGATLPGR